MKAIVFMAMFCAIRAVASPSSPISNSTDTIINLPLADTWRLFTTSSGWKDMGYGNASATTQLGGKLHAEHLIDQSEIVDATITSIDPEHMLSLQSDDQHWSILYFTAMGNDMCQIKWVELSSSADDAVINSASRAHRKLFDQLVRRYAPECHVCKEEREASHK